MLICFNVAHNQFRDPLLNFNEFSIDFRSKLKMRGTPNQRGHPYEYYVLWEALSRATAAVSPEKAAVYGVIAEWSAPKSTKGPDVMMIIKITDLSLCTPYIPPENNDDDPSLPPPPPPPTQHDAEVRLFASDLSELPNILKRGDIIRFHRVQLQNFNGKPQIIGKISTGARPNNIKTSYVVFHGAPPPHTPEEHMHLAYDSSHPHYYWDQNERLLLDAVRRFVAGGRWNQDPSAEALRYLKTIPDAFSTNERDEMQHGDLVVFVLLIEKLVAGGVGAGAGGGSSGGATTAGQLLPTLTPTVRPEVAVVWVWDGRDAPPYPPQYTTAQKPSQAAQSGLAGAAMVPPTRRPFPSTPCIDQNIAMALPQYGFALPILFTKEQVSLPEPGTWVKLRNVGLQVAAGQLQAVMLTKSSWFVADEPETSSAVYANRCLESMTSEWGHMSAELWAVTTPLRAHPFSPLRAIHMEAGDRAPQKYRCLVRLLHYQPLLENGEAGMACLPASRDWATAHAYEGYTDENAWIFGFKFVVEDGTGSVIIARLYGKDAEEFFKNVVTPQDLRENEGARRRLAMALDALMGKLDAHAGTGGGTSDGSGSVSVYKPRWMEVCMKSYKVENEVYFRIFGSVMKSLIELGYGASVTALEGGVGGDPNSQQWLNYT